MPWTTGDTPVTMDRLLGLVKLGTTLRASAAKPDFRKRAMAGLRPAAMAASKYAGSEPSMQTMTTGPRGGGGVRPLPGPGGAGARGRRGYYGGVAGRG